MKIDTSGKGNRKSILSMLSFGILILPYAILQAVSTTLNKDFSVHAYSLIAFYITGIISYYAFNSYAKKKKTESKLINFIAWSNIVTWIVPILGVFTAFSTLGYLKGIDQQKHKKYLVIALISLVLNFVDVLFYYAIK